MDRKNLLKSRLRSIPEEVPELRKEGDGSMCGPCPNPGCIDNPPGRNRFVYRTDTGRFWCRKCRPAEEIKPGDVIDFHRWRYGVTFKELLKQYVPEGQQGDYSIPGVWENLIKTHTNETPVYGLFSDNRGISRDVVGKLITSKNVCFSNHIGKVSVACAFQELNSAKKVLAIQYITVSGEPFRDVPDKDGKKKNKVFKKGSKSGQQCFFQAGKDIEDANTIILTEAVVNAVSVSEWVPDACALALGGSTFYKKVAALRKARDEGKKIICFFDNDGPGEKAAIGVARILGVKTHSVTWAEGSPDGHDANDLLMEGKGQTIIDMVENAEPVKVKRKARQKSEKTAPYTGSNRCKLTDLGNAERMVDRCGDSLRFIPLWGKWLVWDDTHWKSDDTFMVNRLAKETVKEMYAVAAAVEDDEEREALVRFATQSERASALEAMIKLVKSELPVPITPERLDANDWLFNVKNGTIDLKTGKIRNHDKLDLLTKCSPTHYDRNATCPTWESFLDRIMDGNRELIEFIQRAVGYAMTGDVGEQCFFFLYGTGANGKSVFLTVIGYLFADYSQQADFSTFITKQSDTIRNDLARMKGARFISASEAGAGQSFSEVIIKQLTGGDTITARFLHKEFFEFKATFKIFLAANHKPIIRGTDHAIWRRIKMIPFSVKIPKAERDPNLPKKLRAELPGILNWALEGCRKWLSDGLGEPDAIKHATDSYRDEMDILSGFIDEICVVNSMAKVPVADLYKEYVAWCDANTENPIKKRTFGTRLTEKGFESGKSGSKRLWKGIGIRNRDVGTQRDITNQGRDIGTQRDAVFPIFPLETYRERENPETASHYVPMSQSEIDCNLCDYTDKSGGMCCYFAMKGKPTPKPKPISEAARACPLIGKASNS